MDEATINRYIGKSASWYHKISDAGRGQKPFDTVGIFKDKALYIEAKYLPSPKSFNFNRLENHQIANLLAIEELDQGRGNFVPLVLIAVNYGRGAIRIYYYTDMANIDKRKREKKNILKKEFDVSTNYVVVKKGLIDFDCILN